MRRPPPTYDDRQTLEVRGVTRTYWVAPDPPPAQEDQAAPAEGPRPLLIGFHGLGSSGSRMSRWSALGLHGPRAGFLCVFPDAIDTIWDDHGCGRRDGADDIGFVQDLVAHLIATGAADPGRIVFAGVSSGCCFLERIVRIGAVQVKGMALITGTTRVASTDGTPIAARPTPVMMMLGTADPLTPYEGGVPRGPMGRNAMRHVRRMLLDPSGHDFVPAEALAAEWAAVNGCGAAPVVDAVQRSPGSHPVARMTWSPEAPTGRSVVLYRIDGGGHGWPGGKQYLPAKLIGRIPQHLDATAMVLEFARSATHHDAVSR